MITIGQPLSINNQNNNNRYECLAYRKPETCEDCPSTTIDSSQEDYPVDADMVAAFANDPNNVLSFNAKLENVLESICHP